MEIFAFCRAEDIRPGPQEVNSDHEARKARTRMGPSGDIWTGTSDSTKMPLIVLLEVKNFLVKVNLGE